MSSSKSCTATFNASLPSVIQAYPSADNVVQNSTADASKANQVVSNYPVTVGCWFSYTFDGIYLFNWCFFSLLKFDVQSQIQGRTIKKATLRLHVYQLRGDIAQSPQLRLSAMASYWNPATITFNSYKNMQIYLSGQVVKYHPNSSVLPIDFDVTTIVQSWANGTMYNYGFTIEPYNVIFPGYSSYQTTDFQSLEYWWNSTQRPLLIVEFQ